jgi:hypothetical protein
LAQRAYAFEAQEKFELAMNAYLYANLLAPHNDNYLFFSKQCSGKQVDFLLRPWQMSYYEFTCIVERKWRGQAATFPWEDGRAKSNPFHVSSIGPTLYAVQHAVEERLAGRNKKPPAMRFALDCAKPIEQETAESHDIVDAVFSDLSFSDNV